MRSILPSGQLVSSRNIAILRSVFSVLLTLQGNNNYINLITGEKNAVRILHDLCLCHYGYVIHVSIMTVLGYQWQKLANVNWLSCSMHLPWQMFPMASNMWYKNLHILILLLYAYTYLTSTHCSSSSSLSFRVLTKMQGNWPLPIISILILRQFSFYSKYITCCTAHYLLGRFVSLSSFRIALNLAVM